MANTNLTHQMVARMSAEVFSEEAPFAMTLNRGRQEEFGEAPNGFKNGDTVKIKIPPVGRVFDGAVFAEGGAATDSAERFVNLVIDTQKHVALSFGAKEQALEVNDFKERILRPQIQTLSSVVEADLLTKAYRTIPNIVGTAGAIPTTMKTYGQARAKLNNYLAAPGDRQTMFSSDANTELVDSSKALFHKDKAIEMGYLQGRIGEAQMAMFHEHQSIPVHVNGSQNMSVMTVATTALEGATTLAITGGTLTNTIKAGTGFTLGSAATSVFAVHPLTGAAYSFLQQFVVQADVTLSAGAGTISIFPELKASAPNKTVSLLPVATTTIAMFGAASTPYRQNIMYHKDAFTAAFVPLKVIASTQGYTARMPNGISVRVETFGDGKADVENTRIDVLYGFQAVRRLHATRITE